MLYLVIGLLFIVAALLILVVLVQNSKGGGISSSVGISNQVMGVQRSTENVEKITWGLVGGLAVLCILSGFFFNVKTLNAGPRGNGDLDPLKTQFDISTPIQQDPNMTQQPQGGQPNGQPQGTPQTNP